MKQARYEQEVVEEREAGWWRRKGGRKEEGWWKESMEASKKGKENAENENDEKEMEMEKEKEKGDEEEEANPLHGVVNTIIYLIGYIEKAQSRKRMRRGRQNEEENEGGGEDGMRGRSREGGCSREEKKMKGREEKGRRWYQ